MEKESSSSSSSPSEIDWSHIASPLPAVLFEKLTHQAILPPLSFLNLSTSQWHKQRSNALAFVPRGFVDPVSIVYTSFKRFYPSCPSLRSFVRWLTLYEKGEPSELRNYLNDFATRATPIQSVGELVRHVQNLEDVGPIPSATFDDVEQVWIVCSMSIRLPNHGAQLVADTMILDESAMRLSNRGKKSGSSRLFCLFAVTPAGKFSNQLLVAKQHRNLKVTLPSTPFTRIISSSTGDVLPEYLHQWLEDFVAMNGTSQPSALLMDPRTTLFTDEFVETCRKSNLKLCSIDLNVYLTQLLSPLFSLMDKQWTELTRLDQMLMKSASDLQRLVRSIWFILRSLKSNEEICRLFQSSSLWKTSDQAFLESLRSLRQTANLPKRKKKKLSLIKTASKTKLVQPPPMADPPSESTAEEIFHFVAQRQLPLARASRFLGGMKLDYLKNYVSSKATSPPLTGDELLRLNNFMQSASTVDWLRKLRSTYFWPCAKQIFLREIYQLSKLMTRKKRMDMCGHGSLGSVRNCDLQAPANFWKAFEDLHQIQFDNEPIVNAEQWQENFQKFLADEHLDNPTTQLWTLDTFEFPLVKKSTVLQLPEWNEIRPLNSTPKVTVLYAFSSTGRAIDPVFIFPQTFKDPLDEDPKDFFDELGHFTGGTFLSWIEKNFVALESPVALVFCSRLPILSPAVLARLNQLDVHPFGFPSSRTLPFRYLFERRVRNNRSTNLMSELWKKKLLEEQRTHVLKGSACSAKTIKFYFQQIWSQLLHEKQEDDEEVRPHAELCQQAFQQANICVKIPTKKRKAKSSAQIEPLIAQLNQLIEAIGQMKEKTLSASSSQILKMNNQIEENSRDLMDLSSNLNEVMENVENVHPPSTTTGDKRSMDDQDESHLSKRLRSSCPTASTTIQPAISWIPPSKQLVTRLHQQSSSLFQFILSLVQTILHTADQSLTAEHSRWLHATVNHYEDETNFEKINLTIETASKVVQIDLLR